MLSRRVSLSVAAVLLGACTFDFDAVGPRGGAGEGGAPSSGGAPETGGASDGGGPPSCHGSCVDLGDFVGPFSLDETGCQEPVLGGYADASPAFSAAPPTCGCSCELPTELGCAPIALGFHSEVGCEGAPFTLDTAEGACLNPADGGAIAYSFDRPPSGGVTNFSCGSDGAQPIKPAVQFTTPMTACALDESKCENERVCVPEDRTGLCVMSLGERPCPADFPLGRKVLLASELDDDRDCECACGTLTVACNPAFELYKDGSCSTLDASQSSVSCVQSLNGDLIGGIIYRPVPGAGCAAPTESLSGSVTEGPTHTLCCASE